MFGIRLSFLRCQAGLTQAQLGAKLHISAGALGMYEQGRRMPSLRIVTEIAEEFGVSCDFLLSGRGLTEREAAMELMVILFASLAQEHDGHTLKRILNQMRT